MFHDISFDTETDFSADYGAVTNDVPPAQTQHGAWAIKYPNANATLIPHFEQLLSQAQSYFRQTGRHLNVYGDIGELYAAITYGISLNKIYAKGSDGRLGNDYYDVKTLPPFKQGEKTHVKCSSTFNKLVLVRISDDFAMTSKCIDRKSLPAPCGNVFQVSWDALLA